MRGLQGCQGSCEGKYSSRCLLLLLLRGVGCWEYSVSVFVRDVCRAKINKVKQAASRW